MMTMEIAEIWRSMRPDPAGTPRAGAHLETAGQAITTSIRQECVIALPRASYSPDLVTVSVTSLRPGVAGQVTVGANLNSPDGSYQGPTTTVGHGQFTATSSQVLVRFVVLPCTGFPVLGMTPRLIGRTGLHKVLRLIMCCLSATHGYGGDGQPEFLTS
jgi:hypothetical protein